jgi:hypothetical protein
MDAMNRNDFLPLLAASALVAAADLSAQALQPVPSLNIQYTDGHQGVGTPFGLPGFRTQILVEGPTVAPTGAALTGLRFRLDRSSLPSVAGSVPNITIQLSETSVTVPNLDITFATNVTGTPTTVFQGTVQLPAHASAHAGPLPWDIVITFSAPYVFTTANGSLLIDIVGNNPTGGFPTHYLDAIAPGGSATQYGQAGDNPSFDFLNLIAHTGNSLDPRLISIGNVVEYSSTLSFTSPPGFLALGLLPTPGPIDLGFLGATDQYLHIDPLIFAPHAWTQTFIGYASTFQLGVPNDPTWIDNIIYAQSALLDATANPFGLILSHAIETRIGDNQQVFLPMQQLDADDPAATTGTLLDLSFGGNPCYGAVPMLLEGVFF